MVQGRMVLIAVMLVIGLDVAEELSSGMKV